MTDKIDELMVELRSNREACHEMIKDVQNFRKSIDKLLPDKIDHRNKYVWEEKMKTVSNVLDTELSIRIHHDHIGHGAARVTGDYLNLAITAHAPSLSTDCYF